MENKTKILFIIYSLDQGGIETYLLRFLRFSKLKNSHILCKSGRAGTLESEYKKVCEKVTPLRLEYYDFANYFRLYNYLRQGRFTCVCDFTGNFAGAPLAVSSFGGIYKRISFYRSSSDHFRPTYLRQLYNRFSRRLTMRYSTKILANSQAALDFFFPDINKTNKQFSVIYNGVESSDFQCINKSELRAKFTIPNEAFVVGHVGRVCREKNHETIIRVAIELCKNDKKIHFFLVGKGVDSAFSTAIESENLTEQVHLLGYRNDIPRLLNLFDLFYFPSISEGQPNALIEAMISGLPILSSKIDSIQDSVPEHFTDNLIQPEDVKAAVKTIDQLSKNSDLCDKYTCKQWATEHFCAKTLFNQFKNEL